jgi:hypothetical protein
MGFPQFGRERIKTGYKEAREGQKQQKRRKINSDNPPKLYVFVVGARGLVSLRLI